MKCEFVLCGFDGEELLKRMHITFRMVSQNISCKVGQSNAYLPGTGDNRDPSGGSPRVRPYHCTPAGLTFAIAPNAGDSGAQFLLVGDCVRAIP